MLKRFFSWWLFLVLISPFLILGYFFRAKAEFDFDETLWAFKNSVLQSFFSSVLILVIGFFVALGLIRIPERNRVSSGFFSILCLFPQFVPTILVLIGLLSALQPFPMGVVGTILVHTFLHFGLAAILFQNQFRVLLGETSEVARTLGSSRGFFWKRVGLPLLKKDFLLFFLFFFSVCFTSFSVPLVVSGGKGTTLEVLIFEKMRLSSDWSSAIWLAWIQSIFILGLSLATWRARVQTQEKATPLEWLGSYWGLLPLLVFMGGFFASWSAGIAEGLEQIGNLEPYFSDILWGVWNSLALAGLTFGLVILGLKSLAYIGTLPLFLDRFLCGYLAPSTALTCFGILVLFPAEHLWSFLKIPIAFFILSLPAIYRLGWGEKLKSLHHQIFVSRTFGASPGQIFKVIVWPQLRSSSRFMGAIVTTWVCGDFAVSRILSTRDFTLGLILETLLSSYRTSLASLLSVLLIVICGLCFFLIMGLDYVDRRSFKG